MSALLFVGAAITVLAPSTALSRMWDLRPVAYQELLAIGWPAGVGFLLLAAVAMASAIGLYEQRRWAWVLTVLGLFMNVAGDAIQMVLGSYLEGATGVIVAAVSLWWFYRPQVRAEFR